MSHRRNKLQKVVNSLRRILDALRPAVLLSPASRSGPPLSLIEVLVFEPDGFDLGDVVYVDERVSPEQDGSATLPGSMALVAARDQMPVFRCKNSEMPERQTPDGGTRVTLTHDRTFCDGFAKDWSRLTETSNS